jgi:hypothetical protein
MPHAESVNLQFGKPLDEIRLVLVVGSLYLTLDHTMSAFSLPLDHQCFSSSRSMGAATDPGMSGSGAH